PHHYPGHPAAPGPDVHAGHPPGPPHLALGLRQPPPHPHLVHQRALPELPYGAQRHRDVPQGAAPGALVRPPGRRRRRPEAERRLVPRRPRRLRPRPGRRRARPSGVRPGGPGNRLLTEYDNGCAGVRRAATMTPVTSSSTPPAPPDRGPVVALLVTT